MTKEYQSGERKFAVQTSERWLTQEQRDASILPQVVDNGQITVCDSISGGADLVDGMPRRLSLLRFMPDGTELRAVYLQVESGEMLEELPRDRD